MCVCQVIAALEVGSVYFVHTRPVKHSSETGSNLVDVETEEQRKRQDDDSQERLSCRLIRIGWRLLLLCVFVGSSLHTNKIGT